MIDKTISVQQQLFAILPIHFKFFFRGDYECFNGGFTEQIKQITQHSCSKARTSWLLMGSRQKNGRFTVRLTSKRLIPFCIS